MDDATTPNDPSDVETKIAKQPSPPEEKPVCGVVMPIAAFADYTDDHWRRVQRIIRRAITAADMVPRLVWENPGVDVIQARILQGIYDSDVVICDVSGLNPNVMLELGLRLSTKKPTIVITDAVQKPPFDIGVFQYHEYQRDLEYNSVDDFINEIKDKIIAVYDAYKSRKYKSFVDNFTFEIVSPNEVIIPAEEALREKLDSVSNQLARIERNLPKSGLVYSNLSAHSASVSHQAAIVSLRVEYSKALAEAQNAATKLVSLENWRASLEGSHPGRTPNAGETLEQFEIRRKNYFEHEQPLKLAEVDDELRSIRARHAKLSARADELARTIADADRGIAPA